MQFILDLKLVKENFGKTKNKDLIKYSTVYAQLEVFTHITFTQETISMVQTHAEGIEYSKTSRQERKHTHTKK